MLRLFNNSMHNLQYPNSKAIALHFGFLRSYRLCVNVWHSKDLRYCTDFTLLDNPGGLHSRQARHRPHRYQSQRWGNALYYRH